MARGISLARRLPAAALWLALCGCPHQELAPLLPCTASIATLDATQSGTDQVDLLFVIDDSGSMSEEQEKLNKQLQHLVQVLTSGDFDGVPNADGKPDFQPVGSLQLGVTSSDLGSNGVQGILSCGNRSFAPTEQDTGRAGADNVDRPFGDDGQLLNSTAVALAGVSVQKGGEPVVAIPPRPECGGFEAPRFLEFKSGGSASEIADKFSCVAQLGANGCGIEQQLEAMWKALAPSTDRSFSRGSAGQGAPTGTNSGFLRPEAILAVIMVTDEEDCSNPDSSVASLYSSTDKDLNVLCGRNPDKLHQVQRYVTGLKSLKAEAFQDRIIFAGIVGVPLAVDTQGLTLDQILARADMQFAEDDSPSGKQPRPTCSASNGAGSAAPARRIVEVAKGFGQNGVITSICEDDYAGALNAVITKIAAKLSGQCLPRSLLRDSRGFVGCRVVEIKRAGDQSGCDAARGRLERLKDREVEGTARVVCEVAELPVLDRKVPAGVGWYYDDFSAELSNCKNGKQRIAFAAASPLEDGARALIECYRPVAEPSPTARGAEAVNTSCVEDGSGGLSGDAKCQGLSTPDAALVCLNGTCQVACSSGAQCPPGRVCTASGGAVGYCENPTCPVNSAGG